MQKDYLNTANKNGLIPPRIRPLMYCRNNELLNTLVTIGFHTIFLCYYSDMTLHYRFTDMQRTTPRCFASVVPLRLEFNREYSNELSSRPGQPRNPRILHSIARRCPRTRLHQKRILNSRIPTQFHA